MAMESPRIEKYKKKLGTPKIDLKNVSISFQDIKIIQKLGLNVVDYEMSKKRALKMVLKWSLRSLNCPKMILKWS